MERRKKWGESKQVIFYKKQTFSIAQNYLFRIYSGSLHRRLKALRIPLKLNQVFCTIYFFIHRSSLLF